MNIQDAEIADAGELAYLINLAGEGIPAYLWSAKVGADETPLDVGKRRAARETGGFSYRNAQVIKRDGRVVAMMIAYQLDDPYELGNLAEVPEVVRPLLELESRAPGSWYINAIASDDAFRGQGLATALMEEAEVTARARGAAQMSLIVASENHNAKALYLRLGYGPVGSLPVVDYPGALHGGDWILMTKSL